MTISMSKAKSLCNASELSLVADSGRSQLGALSASQLRQDVARSRKLRDKWRDQAERQRREVQLKQGARQTSASARSSEKAQLFAEVLDRFETRLTKTDGEASGPAARKTKPRRVRSAGHRADRAVIREDLDQTRLEMKEAQRASRAKTALKKSAKSVKPIMKALAPSIGLDPNPSKKRSIGPVQTKSARSTSQLAAAQGLRFTVGQQGRIDARAKRNRLKVGGLVRIQKHTSSQNKRRQATRDSR